MARIPEKIQTLIILPIYTTPLNFFKKNLSILIVTLLSIRMDPSRCAINEAPIVSTILLNLASTVSEEYVFE